MLYRHAPIRLALDLHCCFVYTLKFQLLEFRSRASSVLLCESLHSSRLLMCWSQVSQKGNHGKNRVIILSIINENALRRRHFNDVNCILLWILYFGDTKLMARMFLQLIFRKFSHHISHSYLFLPRRLLFRDKFPDFCKVCMMNNYSLWQTTTCALHFFYTE